MHSVRGIVTESSWTLTANSYHSYMYHSTCIEFIYSPTAIDLREKFTDFSKTSIPFLLQFHQVCSSYYLVMTNVG